MVRLLNADGEDMHISVPGGHSLASALIKARGKIKHVGAVQGLDGNRISVDW